jgi:hypothetical protein
VFPSTRSRVLTTEPSTLGTIILRATSQVPIAARGTPRRHGWPPVCHVAPRCMPCRIRGTCNDVFIQPATWPGPPPLRSNADCPCTDAWRQISSNLVTPRAPVPRGRGGGGSWSDLGSASTLFQGAIRLHRPYRCQGRSAEWKTGSRRISDADVWKGFNC